MDVPRRWWCPSAVTCTNCDIGMLKVKREDAPPQGQATVREQLRWQSKVAGVEEKQFFRRNVPAFALHDTVEDSTSKRRRDDWDAFQTRNKLTDGEGLKPVTVGVRSREEIGVTLTKTVRGNMRDQLTEEANASFER